MTLTVFKNTHFLLVTFTILTCFCCKSQSEKKITATEEIETEAIVKEIVLGASQVEEYLPLLKNKKIGIVANQTSVLYLKNENLDKNSIQKKIEIRLHLVDYLYNKKINIQHVFAPEHGFRGKADAGELIKDGVDSKTGLSIISLYGKNKKPSIQQLKGIEIMIFDIQDVGARFYTYISTLHYIMEACAELNIPLLILDRPNPNGHYIDGPILEKQHKSFVGMHPVPVIHGMTIGEYAQMINGEGWLENGVKCHLTIIKLKNYTHQTEYSLPIRPSPNLPNDGAINLYPSLCFFEGTPLSAGRGTEMQFQIFGTPKLPEEFYPFTFTPQANEGAKYPKFKNEVCHGKDLRKHKKLNKLNLEWLIEAYSSTEKKEEFFSPFFTKLAGTTKLQAQLEEKVSEADIKASWQEGLEKFKIVRKKYIIYQ